MTWTKATIETTTLGAEIVTGVLISAGIVGTEIIDPQDRIRHLTSVARTWDYADESLLTAESDIALVVFYVTVDAAGEKLIETVKQELAQFANNNEMGSLALSIQEADEEAWANEWKKHFKPLSLGNVTVVPEWEDYTAKANETILRIEPGAAFGTGQHQTTQLCIYAMQEWVKPGDKIIDIGCGSGILSILGLLLKADSVFACDIDPAGAMSATKRNGALNSIDMAKLTIRPGDILSDKKLVSEIKQKKYEVVVANIVADVVKEIAPIAPDFMTDDGTFIASGIITERLDDILQAFADAGLTVVWQKEIDGWHSLVGKRTGSNS